MLRGPIARAGRAGRGSRGAAVAPEGTWELVEWHVDGEVLRPPQAGGRWLNHDGVVVATFHRETAGGFESFVGYMPNGRLLRKYRKVNE